MSVRAIVGLGSNLGSREAWLRVALARLDAEPAVSVEATSRPYLTPPVGPPQPDYVNAAVALRTTLDARALLDRLLSVERELGRERLERWGPRTVDLDLLHWGAGPVLAEGLEVPHPRLTERPFALAPLLEVAPDLVPRYGPDLERSGGAPEAGAWTAVRRGPGWVEVDALDACDAVALAMSAAWGGSGAGAVRPLEAPDLDGWVAAALGSGAVAIRAWGSDAIHGLGLGTCLDGPPLQVSVEGSRAVAHWNSP